MVTVIGVDETAKSRVTCHGHSRTKPGCGSILEYTRADIREYRGTDYSGGPDGRDWIVCPKCGNEITLRAW